MRGNVYFFCFWLLTTIVTGITVHSNAFLNTAYGEHTCNAAGPEFLSEQHDYLVRGFVSKLV
jgi:hypothetical protein